MNNNDDNNHHHHDHESESQCPLRCYQFQQLMDYITLDLPFFGFMDVQLLYDHAVKDHQVHIHQAGHTCPYGDQCPTVLKEPDPYDCKAVWHREFYHPEPDDDEEEVERHCHFPPMGVSMSPPYSPEPIEIKNVSSIVSNIEKMDRRQSVSSNRRMSLSRSSGRRRPSIGLALSLSLDRTFSIMGGSPECSVEPEESIHNVLQNGLNDSVNEKTPTPTLKKSFLDLLWTDERTETLFVYGYCRQHFGYEQHTDVVVMIAKYLGPASGSMEQKDSVLPPALPFIRRLGLLEWKKSGHADSTRKLLEGQYGEQSAHKLCDSIQFGISDCIYDNKLDNEDDLDELLMYAVADDLSKSTNGSNVMNYISNKIFTKDHALTLDQYQEKQNLHCILWRVLQMENEEPFQMMDSDDDSDDEIEGIPQFNFDNSGYRSPPPPPLERPLSNVLIETVPSPTTAMVLQRTASSLLSPDCSIVSLEKEISHGLPDEDANNSCSFILETMVNEFNEKGTATEKIKNLQRDILGLRPKSAEPINLRLDFKNRAFKVKAGNARKRCPENLLVGDRKHVLRMKRDYGVSKACEMMNRIPFVINMANLFSEIRISQHYINVLKRQNPPPVEECASPELEAEYKVEPFGNNEAVYNINEFIKSHPLTRGNKKIAQHIGSVLKQIVTKLLRPLPLQPSFVIMDKLLDFLLYHAKIASFVRNRLHRSKKAIPGDPDALNLPIQMDFWIIPQCVTEPGIDDVIRDGVSSNYEHKLPLKFGDEIIGDIGEILSKVDPEGTHHVTVELTRPSSLFDKTLVKRFNELRRKLPEEHGQRYIFIVDRRDPESRNDPNYKFNGQKNWVDTLYILCPSGLHQQYSEVPPSSELYPETLIEHTLECLLPLSQNEEKRIGAKHVCNGYMFATSYQLFQEDKVKTYFMSNGYAQRFSQYEYQYYWPRLFMKVDGKFQDEVYTDSSISEHRRDFDKFFVNHDDREHFQFKRYTMSFAEDTSDGL